MKTDRIQVRRKSSCTKSQWCPELAKILEQDIERLKSKETRRIDEEESAGGGVQELVNKLLVADSIFVFAAFAALGVSLAVQGIFHSEVSRRMILSVSDEYCYYRY